MLSPIETKGFVRGEDCLSTDSCPLLSSFLPLLMFSSSTYSPPPPSPPISFPILADLISYLSSAFTATGWYSKVIVEELRLMMMWGEGMGEGVGGGSGGGGGRGRLVNE
ncbi:unnamed protein product [Onchocerca flexuosa]|uniref:Uncharacterized protein n=1 Tax=Onchocerca flexuosa TaxID=387005 RepID=A0A183I4Q7_9BILA|nr:unnamed protein product [Onchocerca flexuosa]